jgi:hypothetical protein
LVERGVKSRIIAKTKSANFDDKAEFPLTFRAPRNGVTTYEVHAKCDSYVGVDQMKTVHLRVEPRPTQPIKVIDTYIYMHMVHPSSNPPCLIRLYSCVS